MVPNWIGGVFVGALWNSRDRHKALRMAESLYEKGYTFERCIAVALHFYPAH